MNKPVAQSLTIWGAVATGAVSLAAMWGIDLNPGEIELVLSSAAVIVSTCVTIWGRIRRG